MPILQKHQLRVAAVAKIVCDSCSEETDDYEIITACLLHDMGNIIKFDLSFFPEFLEPEGEQYWRAVRTDFLKKYGDNEHEATVMIAKEIGVSERVIVLINAIGFSQIPKAYESNDLSVKIAAYADSRVTPHGVTDLEGRLREGRERYKNHFKKKPKEDSFYEEMIEIFKKVESQIFENVPIYPEDINDSSVNTELEGLENWGV
jgi:hypothetical protein